MWDGSFHTPRKKRIWRNAVGREGETGLRDDCFVLRKFTTPNVPPHPWRKSVLHPAQVSSMPEAVLFFWENAMCWQSKVCMLDSEALKCMFKSIDTLMLWLYILLITHFIYSCIDTIYSLHHILYTVSFTVCAHSYVCTAYLLLRRRHSRREKRKAHAGWESCSSGVRLMVCGMSGLFHGDVDGRHAVCLDFQVFQLVA